MPKHESGMGDTVKQAALSYPTYGLQDAVRLGQAVSDLGGANKGVERSLLAARLKMVESAPSLSSLVTSARCFGVIERGGVYTLTDLSKKYFFPGSEMERRIALVEFLKRPRAFALVIERFDGNRLPEAGYLKNIIEKECRIPATWSGRVASLFLRSAGYAGATDAGFLRVAAALRTAQTTQDENEPSSLGKSTESIKLQEHERKPSGDVGDSRGRLTVWVDGEVRLETPKNMNTDDWDKLVRYVQILKPRNRSEE